MLEIVSKYKKGTQIQIGENRAIITSDLMKFKTQFKIIQILK